MKNRPRRPTDRPSGPYQNSTETSPRELSRGTDSRDTSSQLIRQRETLGPRSSDAIPAVVLKNRSHFPLQYRKRIHRTGDAKPGDLVAVYSGNEMQPYAYGLYNSRSELALRLLWSGPELPTDEHWNEKLSSAISLRRDILQIPKHANAWRVIHAESDGLSGLVVDYFAGVVSAEVFSLAMYQRAAILIPRIAAMLDAPHWMVKTSPQFLSQEGCDPPPLSSPGCPDNVIVQEYGTRFRIRFEGGHKTGFFCDQRENRRRLADFCSGRSVLDLCCYTGGFSVQAKTLGKADDVTGVDLDEEPLKIAKENANLNQARVRFVQADIFSYMREMLRNNRQFDVVVLDPPKLIRSRPEIEEGTRRHFAMNRLAIKLVRPGGLLLTCSCAGLLPDAQFTELVADAARSCGGEVDTELDVPRSLQMIARSGAAPDHPVSSSCLETEYLKAIWAIVR